MPAQESFLKNYFPLVSDEESKKMFSSYVLIGEKDNNFYFIRPTNVMTKIFIGNYAEKEGFSYFGFNPITNKLTQGRQSSFIDSKKLNIDAIPSFDLDFVSENLKNKFELTCSIEELYQSKDIADSGKELLKGRGFYV